MNKKLIIGFILGYVGYVAYQKLKSTTTVTVNTFDTPVPGIMDVSTIAGRRY